MNIIKNLINKVILSATKRSFVFFYLIFFTSTYQSKSDLLSFYLFDDQEFVLFSDTRYDYDFKSTANQYSFELGYYSGEVSKDHGYNYNSEGHINYYHNRYVGRIELFNVGLLIITDSINNDISFRLKLITIDISGTEGDNKFANLKIDMINLNSDLFFKERYDWFNFRFGIGRDFESGYNTLGIQPALSLGFTSVYLREYYLNELKDYFHHTYNSFKIMASLGIYYLSDNFDVNMTGDYRLLISSELFRELSLKAEILYKVIYARWLSDIDFSFYKSRDMVHFTANISYDQLSINDKTQRMLVLGAGIKVFWGHLINYIQGRRLRSPVRSSDDPEE